MKNKTRRFSKSAFSVILALCMLLSCLTVGVIPTGAANVEGESTGASSTYTVYFRNNGNWSNVYVLTGSNLNMSGSSGAYEDLYGSNINNFTAMSLVPGETKVYKASVTVYDNKIAFASANSTQSGYYASSGQICCVGDMSSGKVVNMWTDSWTSRNGAAYKKYNLEDYTPPTPNITGINSDWNTGDGMTLDSGNNYYYAFTGDGYDKYFRFKFSDTYYEAYANNFDLQTGSGGPYDGSSDAKKYGAREGNGNAFKLTASTDYNYRIYFDISGKKTWFTKTERTHSVAIKRQLGSGSATNVSTATIGNVTGVSVTANETVTSGSSSYTFDHWAISGGTVSISDTQNGTYTSKAAGTTYSTRNIYVKTASDSAVLTAVYRLNLPALSAPTNVTLNESAADCTVSTTTVGAKIRLAWSSVQNAGSYKVYKGTTLVTTVTTLYYDIERANSSTGSYSVVAVPSNASSYSESANSTARTLTVNKSRLNTPTLTVSPTAIANGDEVSLTVTDTNTSFTAAQFNYYYYTGSSVTISNDYLLTPGTAKTLTPTSNTTYMACAYPVGGTNNDYYLQSYSTSGTTVNVYTPAWYIVGDLVDSGDNKWSTSNTNFPVDTYDSPNVFKRTITYASGGTNDKHYFRLNNGTNQYGTGSDISMATYDGSTSAKKLTCSTTGTTGAMYVTGQGTYTIYVDQSTSGSPKVWVVATAPQTYTTTVYVNQDSNATNLYVWKQGTGEIAAWPGAGITGTTESVNDIPYYKYTFTGYLDHFSMVVNKGSGNAQSADITNKEGDKTYYVIWDGTNNSAASCSETAPVIQLGYKVQNSSSDNHADFSSRSVTVSLVANTTYEFWLKSANSHLNDQGNGTMTRANCTNWSFPVNNTNTKIQTDLAGTYTFTYTVSNGNISVSVTYPPEPKYNVTVNQGDHGTVKVNGSNFTSGNTVQVGSLTTASIEAVAASGYHFTGWTTSGGVAAVSGYTTSSNPITISASAQGTITATYAENSYTLTLASGGNGSITTPSSKTLTVHPITATSLSGVTVTPANGYKFNGWTAGTGVTLTDGSTSSPSTGSVKATQDSTLTAKFTKVSYTLTGKTSLNGTVGNYGTVKFYSDQACTTQITTSQIGNTVYAKFASDSYALVDFTLAGTGSATVSTTGNVLKFIMGYANVTVTANVREQPSITYYVDMHNNDMTGKSVEVAIVTNAGGGVVVKDSNNADCKKTLVQQGNSTVYAESIPTPITKTGNTYGEFYVRVKYGSYSTTLNISSANATTIMNSSSREVWIEGFNEAGNTFKITSATNTTPAVENGKKRIYVAKPFDWQNTETSWKNLRLYHWGEYADIGWSTTPEMTYIGYDSNYHYYYVDVDSGVSNIIFQGWKDNSTYPDVQTGNIENIGSANYFVLSKEGSAYIGTKGENATAPGYTRHVSRVDMNVGQTANITPTHTGAKVTYSSNNENVTVTSEGEVSATASAEATITVNVYGTVGAKATGNDATDGVIGDSMTYTVTVSVRNPGVFSGFKVMSYAHQEYTVTIPTESSVQPGYFVLNGSSVIVNGLYDGAGYTSSYSNSAIITTTAETSVSDVGNMPTTFTVKYAASNTSTGYTNIVLNNATIITRSIKKTGQKRFGFKEWIPSQTTISSSKVINDGVETVTHKGLAFVTGTTTYQAKFEEYDYVDVTFNFKYDEYVPEVVTVTENGVSRTVTNYQYDATWAAEVGAHTTKTYKVSGFEVRNLTTDSEKVAGATNLISEEYLVVPAVAAIEALPSNDYYNYKIESSGITINSTGDYVAEVTVVMTKSVRTYSVYLNGVLQASGYTYQQYADIAPSGQSANTFWYAVDTQNSTDTTNAPLLATGSSYKFRVKGDTYLRTKNGTITDADFNRSEVDFSHYEVTHQGSTSTNMKEYLMQNFYIADFFSPAKVLDPNSDNGQGGHLPYDDAQFVGGGVVYYSMNGVTDNNPGTPFANAVSSGYVGDDGKANANAIKEMLKANIEAQYNKDNVAGTVGEDDAMKAAYGTEIEAKKNFEGGFNTGIIYRYLPLNEYKRDGSGNLETDGEGKYTLAYDVNNNTFRYSNTLQSYQYVYASGNENKATNAGKNMRLYSYYVYSYVAYNQETNVPETRYEIVLSDNYSDASTYWEGPNN